jgi:hypothetical protein
MNENEIDRIAAAANALRPDWPIGSLRTLLNKPELVNRPRRDMAVALAWVACDSQTKTPARVLEAGPWWQAVADPANGGAPRVHWLDRCYVCNYGQAACERVNTGDHVFVTNGDYEAGKVRREQPAPMPEDELRAELRAARSELCPCGVKPNYCAAHDPRRNQPETEAAGPEESNHA